MNTSAVAVWGLASPKSSGRGESPACAFQKCRFFECDRMVTMNLDTFLTSSQDDIISWITTSTESFSDGELDLANAEAVSKEELIFLLSAYKGLDDDGLTANVEGYSTFMRAVEDELRRRYTE